MQRHEAQGLAWYTFPGRWPPHALITRLGGVSRGPFASLNLGHTVGDDPAAVAENHRRLFAQFGLRAAMVVSPHQVHGARVVRVGRAEGGSIVRNCDALITDEPGVVLMMRFADCLPILLYDREHQAIGLAHAGWRGTASGVIAATVEAMKAAFGSRPEALQAGIGPGIGVESYAVGAEVVEAVAATLPPGTPIARWRGGQWYLDLPLAAQRQLESLGVGQITASGLDTAAHTDEWYSHRAERGRTGRFGVLLWLP